MTVARYVTEFRVVEWKKDRMGGCTDNTRSAHPFPAHVKAGAKLFQEGNDMLKSSLGFLRGRFKFLIVTGYSRDRGSLIGREILSAYI